MSTQQTSSRPRIMAFAALFPVLLALTLFGLSHFGLLELTQDVSAAPAAGGGHDHAAHGSPIPQRPPTDPPTAFDGMPPVGTRAHCPVMNNDFEVNEGTLSSSYNGKTYVYCCPGCKPLFDADPEKYLAPTPAATAAEAAPAAVLANSDAPGNLYTCPMHPEVVNEGPGSCPICKMDLVPMTGERAGGGSETGAGGVVTVDPVVVQNMGVRVVSVTRGPVHRNVRTVGEVLIAEDEVSVVNLRYSGWIERILVDQTGQRVKRGQPLFRVYSPELMAAQEEYLLAVAAEGPESMLARSVARRLELWGIGKGQLRRIAKRGKASRSLTVSSPRSGYVLHKNVVQGAHVRAGMDLYRIGDLDRVWVNAEIYEFDAPWVRAGQPATMELPFHHGRTFAGEVAYVYPTLNPKSRTLTVRLEFDNPGVDLKPGMLATVRIETRQKEDVITIPTEAVLHSGERLLVFVVKGYGRYEPRQIVTGLVADDRRTEVLEGLAEGEQVVVSGQFLLDSESQLQEAVQKLIEARLHAKSADARAGGSGATPSGGASYWTCGMCPQVVQDGPGSCPVCGMDLVEKKR